MQLDKQAITKIAKLARIKIADDEVEGYAKELSQILDLADQLKEVNTEGVMPMAGVGQNTLRLRADEITDGGKQKQVLENAPQSSYGCFVVPKVIE